MIIFWRQCRRILGSITYLAFVGILAVMYLTQFHADLQDDLTMAEKKVATDRYANRNPFAKPLSGEDDYGWYYNEVPEIVMQSATMSLLFEYDEGAYAAYPFGFYVTVRPGQTEQIQIAKILEEITGKKPQELMALFMAPQSSMEEPLPIQVTYADYQTKLAEVDRLLGGGSNYAPKWLAHFSRVPYTYEDRLQEFEGFVEGDRVTGAYARLFCDYLGITLGLFGVFLPVSMLMADKRRDRYKKMDSSFRKSAAVMINKFLAVNLMMLIPLLILAVVPTMQISAMAKSYDYSVDYAAFFKYILIWLLPLQLMVTATGFFFTTVTGTWIGIPIQFAASCYAVATGAVHMTDGVFGMNLILRFNVVGRREIYERAIPQLIVNRGFYLMLSMLLLLTTIYIFNRKIMCKRP